MLEDVDIIVQGHNLPYSRLIRRQKLLSSMWVLSGVQIEMRPDLVTSLWEPAHGAIRGIIEWISRREATDFLVAHRKWSIVVVIVILGILYK